ncbi:MAG: UTP--glucose-1-phosphate uridylyltransferase GalU [Fibrobacterota bacterium]
MIRKAVIPAAGFGTRFLPAAKVQPKEMLPIIDTPTIQLVVEEAAAAGITDILMIIGKGKHVIEDHFDRNFQLEYELNEKNKTEQLEQIKRINDLANIHFIRQKELNGLGDAIYYSRFHIGNEPFAVLLGDTIVQSETPAVKQLMDLYDEFGKTIIGLEEVEKQKVGRYGIIDGESIKTDTYRIKNFIEKPSPEEAPSNLAIAGRYILTPDIFKHIEKTKADKNREIQITNALSLLSENEDIYAYRFSGKRYDIGNKLDFLKTNVELGIRHKKFGKEFREYLKEFAAGL